MLFAQSLDGRQLVLGVEYLKGLRQIGHLVMCAQEPIAQAMEGANPHAPHIHGQHGLQANQHFLGGLVGKGDGQNTARPHLGSLQQPSNSGGEYPGFAGTGPGQYQG